MKLPPKKESAPALDENALEAFFSGGKTTKKGVGDAQATIIIRLPKALKKELDERVFKQKQDGKKITLNQWVTDAIGEKLIGEE